MHCPGATIQPELNGNEHRQGHTVGKVRDCAYRPRRCAAWSSRLPNIVAGTGLVVDRHSLLVQAAVADAGLAYAIESKVAEDLL